MKKKIVLGDYRHHGYKCTMEIYIGKKKIFSTYDNLPSDLLNNLRQAILNGSLNLLNGNDTIQE